MTKVAVDVFVGDVFEDQDPRAKGRRVTVNGIQRGYAFIRTITGDKVKPITKVKVDRLRPIGKKKGFYLIERMGKAIGQITVEVCDPVEPIDPIEAIEPIAPITEHEVSDSLAEPLDLSPTPETISENGG